MSVRWRSASPGVSSTQGTEPSTGSFAQRPPALRHRSPRRRCRRDGRAGRRARTPSRSRGPGPAYRSRRACRGALRRAPPRRQRRRAALPPRTGARCRGRARGDRRPRAAHSSSASLGTDATAPLVPAISSTSTRVRSASPTASRKLSAAAARAVSRSCGPPAPAWTTRRSTPSASQACTVAMRSSRVRRSVVGSHDATLPDVGQVRHARLQPARCQGVAEPLDLRLVVARGRPMPSDWRRRSGGSRRRGARLPRSLPRCRCAGAGRGRPGSRVVHGDRGAVANARAGGRELTDDAAAAAAGDRERGELQTRRSPRALVRRRPSCPRSRVAKNSGPSETRNTIVSPGWSSVPRAGSVPRARPRATFAREVLLDHDLEALRGERIDRLVLGHATHVGDRDRLRAVADDHRDRRPPGEHRRCRAARRSRDPQEPPDRTDA